MKALKTALVNIRRTPHQAFIAIAMVSITFFVAYSLGLILLGSNEVLKFFEAKPQVIAFFKLGTSASDVQIVKQKIEQQDFVKQVKLISKEEALQLYRKDNQENPLLLELVTAEILPASIEISTYQVEDLIKTQQFLEDQNQIDEVVLQQDIIDTLISWTNAVRTVGLIIMSALAVTSFFIITVIISLKAVGKKIAINVMSLIGANSTYIIMPFMYEGMIYSLLGSSIGFGGMYLALLYATPWLNSFLQNIISLPLPPALLVMQYSFGTAIGIIFGSFSSLVAVKRMIKK